MPNVTPESADVHVAGPCSTLLGMPEGQATITVTRKSPEDVRHRQIYVSVDGKEFAELLYGETFTGAVPAGRHQMRANNTLVWKTLQCDLRPGEHARFTVVNRPGFGTYTLLTLLGAGPIYLTFEREPAYDLQDPSETRPHA
jgi:hypothetical protein